MSEAADIDIFRVLDELKNIDPELATLIDKNMDEGKMVHIIDRRHLCSKVKYGHKPTAKKATESMHRKTGHSYDTYHCEPCEAWHIGHAK